MKLTIRKSQSDVKGIFGGHKGAKFTLQAKCIFTEKEKSLIAQYVGGIYIVAEHKMPRQGADAYMCKVTIEALIKGVTVEAEEVGALHDFIDALKEGCLSLKNMLEMMADFSGEEVFEI
jgi:hypothetical protein